MEVYEKVGLYEYLIIKALDVIIGMMMRYEPANTVYYIFTVTESQSIASAYIGLCLLKLPVASPYFSIAGLIPISWTIAAASRFPLVRGNALPDSNQL
jgi:hypothetical protein